MMNGTHLVLIDRIIESMSALKRVEALRRAMRLHSLQAVARHCTLQPEIDYYVAAAWLIATMKA